MPLKPMLIAISSWAPWLQDGPDDGWDGRSSRGAGWRGWTGARLHGESAAGGWLKYISISGNEMTIKIFSVAGWAAAGPADAGQQPRPGGPAPETDAGGRPALPAPGGGKPAPVASSRQRLWEYPENFIKCLQVLLRRLYGAENYSRNKHFLLN